jgi:hypothetical protein
MSARLLFWIELRRRPPRESEIIYKNQKPISRIAGFLL